MTGDFIDAVAFTGHKGLLGPQGTGGLVLAEGLEQELYECACRMLELQDNLLQRWRQSDQHIIQLGASTIPSAYILPEVLPRHANADSLRFSAFVREFYRAPQSLE